MAHTVHVRLDLQVDSESISGSVCDQDGRPSTFVGWLGLIAVVEQVQADLGGSDGARATPPGDRSGAPNVDRPGARQHDD